MIEFSNAHYELLSTKVHGDRSVLVRYLRGEAMYYCVLTVYWESVDELTRYEWVLRCGDSFHAMETMFKEDVLKLEKEAVRQFARYGHRTLHRIPSD